MNLLLTLLVLAAFSAYAVYRIESLARRLEAGGANDARHARSSSAEGQLEAALLARASSGNRPPLAEGTGGRADVLRGEDPGRAPSYAVSEVREPARPNRFIEQARRVVESRLADTSFGVDDLADQLGLSSRQVQRRLRESTGLSPNAFIRGIRLQEAARLLLHTESPIAAIAEDTGFGSASYFSKCFRDFYGETPMSHARKWTSVTTHATGNGMSGSGGRPSEVRPPIGRAPQAVALRAVQSERG